ncbi:MAG: TauD/TfdA family dioxygenase [Proteobacteria bacterium]|nr:TauD/TfdA family dioxygenase [Pseudomonadota bacterium]
MALTITPMHSLFVAEVKGLDISMPLSPAIQTQIQNLIDQHGILVFRDQNISNDQQIAFTRYFGEIEIADTKNNITKQEDRRLSNMLADISNLNKNNEVHETESRQRIFNLGNRIWHSDSAFRPNPARYSLLSAREIPSKGGDTQYADMHTPYERLSSEMKELIADLRCEHSLMYSRARLGMDYFTEQEKEDFKPVIQPLVRTHPATGRKSLFLASHAGRIVGWPIADAKLLLEELTEIATQREYVYTHKWKHYDLVMWDNRRTMHRATRFEDTKEKRDMRRTTVAGDPA